MSLRFKQVPVCADAPTFKSYMSVSPCLVWSAQLPTGAFLEKAHMTAATVTTTGHSVMSHLPTASSVSSSSASSSSTASPPAPTSPPAASPAVADSVSPMPPPPRCSCYAVSIVRDGSVTRVSCNCPSSSRLLCKHCWCAIIALGGKDYWGIDLAALRFDAEDSVHETGSSTVEVDESPADTSPPGDVEFSPEDQESLNQIFALLRTATQDKNASDLDLYLRQLKYCMDSLRRGHVRIATAQTFAHTHQHFALRNNSHRQEAPVVVQLSGSSLTTPVPAFVSAPRPATKATKNRQQPALPLSELRTLLGLGPASVPVPAALSAAVSDSASVTSSVSASSSASASVSVTTSAATPPVAQVLKV